MSLWSNGFRWNAMFVLKLGELFRVEFRGCIDT